MPIKLRVPYKRRAKKFHSQRKVSLYFAYGANLNHAGMAYRCPKARPVTRGYLEDWELIFSGVASIRPAIGRRVPGALWEITADCERSLDRFEGWPTLYRKQWVQVNGQRAMAYVMTYDDPRLPAGNYLATIQQGYRDWHLNSGELQQAIDLTGIRCSQRNRLKQLNNPIGDKIGSTTSTL